MMSKYIISDDLSTMTTLNECTEQFHTSVFALLFSILKLLNVFHLTLFEICTLIFVVFSSTCIQYFNHRTEKFREEINSKSAFLSKHKVLKI